MCLVHVDIIGGIGRRLCGVRGAVCACACEARATLAHSGVRLRTGGWPWGPGDATQQGGRGVGGGEMGGGEVGIGEVGGEELWSGEVGSGEVGALVRHTLF